MKAHQDTPGWFVFSDVLRDYVTMAQLWAGKGV